MEAPLHDALLRLSGRTSFHMPGHGGIALPYELRAFMDATELPLTDDLYAAEGPILRAQALCAEAVGARHTIFLTNGATAGIEAMLLAALSPGDPFLMPRNAHQSAIHACALGDFRPIFIPPTGPAREAWISPEDVVRAMRASPQAKAVLLTRPDYYGRCIDLATIAREAKALGMRLLVDEAHGAHLPYTGTPPSAASVADACVQSAHKTLPALGGSGWLHSNGLDPKRLLRMLRMVQSSSPSFLAMASLDAVRAYMQREGAARFAEEIRRLAPIRDAFPDAHAEWRAGGIACDPARLVLDVAQMGYTGFEVQSFLEGRGIDMEMADERRLVGIPSILQNEGHTRALYVALRSLPRRDPRPPAADLQPIYGSRACAIREAVFAQTEPVPLAEAVGRVSAVCAGPYPPGIPWLVPGERIGEALPSALLRWRESGGALFGMETGGCACDAKENPACDAKENRPCDARKKCAGRATTPRILVCKER